MLASLLLTVLRRHLPHVLAAVILHPLCLLPDVEDPCKDLARANMIKGFARVQEHLRGEVQERVHRAVLEVGRAFLQFSCLSTLSGRTIGLSCSYSRPSTLVSENVSALMPKALGYSDSWKNPLGCLGRAREPVKTNLTWTRDFAAIAFVAQALQSLLVEGARFSARTDAYQRQTTPPPSSL